MSPRPTLLLRGDVVRPCGFTAINRRLVPGLRARGFDVSVAALDADGRETLPPRLPDLYLFHGDPYDLESAPGRRNVCFLHWEYLELPPGWVGALNARFDLVVAPSHFSREVYEQSGIRIPIAVCPGAVDPVEFHPSVAPWPAPTQKGFRFVHLGGAHWRRGTDVLLRAYAAEFSAGDDVCLLLKPFHYRDHRRWLEQAMEAVARPGGPELRELPEAFDSVAPVFAAADVGVYPLRAECLGLPVLECLATGRPVIVTEGTGLGEFCTKENARFVPAAVRRRGDRTHLEPDASALRAQLREAYRRGKADRAERERVAATVAGFTWEASLARLDEALRRCLRSDPARGHPPSPRGAGARTAPSPPAARDDESGRLYEWVADAAARGRPARRLLPGRAGSALEAFRDAGDAAWKLLVGNGASLEALRRADARERRACGLPSPAGTPFADWRELVERELADSLLVLGEAGRQSLLRCGVPAGRLLLARPGAPDKEPAESRAAGPLRVLFLSDHPFRDGLRLVLEAWDALRPAGCELHCAVSRESLASKRLLRLLVAHPEIVLRPPPGELSLRASGELLAACDCVLHPTRLDGLSLRPLRAMARGRMVAATRAAAVADRITHGDDGYVVAEGGEAVHEALDWIAAHPKRVRALGEEAARSARGWSWDGFRAALETLGGHA